ncbi:histidine phosphatase family protein [Saccharibacillus alkalitolerans]|uniref:Histidine phosphatase family protein n=1 Tax=Saccharibacillus alkalitolerans TaxID=2705290 RepID=A0ABX0F7U9_9BACL|nr:histidine phosphatase family protein [Saccharibacillus alkalitolerans]NGZ75281.1 histidine phosphatase family protein [Saccharibacillus alkalitolerans]
MKKNIETPEQTDEKKETAITTLYMTRHGQTEWNLEGRLQGRKDSPLTEKGLLHARWLRDSLADAPLDAIYSSSSPRALRTADILRGRRALEVTAVDDLREIDMGNWEGRTGTEIQAELPDDYDLFWNDPHLFEPVHGGESFLDLGHRVVPAIERILNVNQGRSLLVVTHAAVLNLLMTAFRRQPVSEMWKPPVLESTCLCKVVYGPEGMKVELHGDVSHYREQA